MSFVFHCSVLHGVPYSPLFDIALNRACLSLHFVLCVQLLAAIDLEKWTQSVPEDWDISLMTILAVVLGFVWLLRRANNQEQERRRVEAAAAAAAAAAASHAAAAEEEEDDRVGGHQVHA